MIKGLGLELGLEFASDMQTTRRVRGEHTQVWSLRWRIWSGLTLVTKCVAVCCCVLQCVAVCSHELDESSTCHERMFVTCRRCWCVALMCDMYTTY